MGPTRDHVIAGAGRPVAVELLAAPYDSGRRDVRMGAGPSALARAGAAAAGATRAVALDLLALLTGLAAP